MVKELFIDGVERTGEKIGEGLIYVLKWMGKGIGNIALGGESLFVIAAMIGIYITMAGNKKLGTKISSISLISYVLIKAVTSA